MNNNGNPADFTTLRVPDTDGVLGNAKVVVPLRCLTDFFRLLEMLLIKSKIHLKLNWTKDCVMSDIAGNATFKITKTKLYVPTVTLSTKDNVSLTKQLNEGFKRPVYLK